MASLVSRTLNFGNTARIYDPGLEIDAQADYVAKPWNYKLLLISLYY